LIFTILYRFGFAFSRDRSINCYLKAEKIIMAKAKVDILKRVIPLDFKKFLGLRKQKPDNRRAISNEQRSG
jgi:hypothetical protein